LNTGFTFHFKNGWNVTVTKLELAYNSEKSYEVSPHRSVDGTSYVFPNGNKYLINISDDEVAHWIGIISALPLEDHIKKVLYPE